VKRQLGEIEGTSKTALLWEPQEQEWMWCAPGGRGFTDSGIEGSSVQLVHGLHNHPLGAFWGGSFGGERD
jgi:hypothetical protein